MLNNLHDVANSCRQNYRDNFNADEIVLSDTFKKAYGISVRSDKQDVDFTLHTAVITTAGNLKMYIPNQWFCAAAFTVPFVQTFIEYKKMLFNIVDAAITGTAKDKKDYIQSLKDTDNSQLKSDARTMFLNNLPYSMEQDEKNATADLLLRFVTDYKWWFGNKTIDRGDSYVSPVLSLLGVVNASQGYIADICYKLATEPALSKAAEEMISTNVDSECSVSPAVDPSVINAQPRVTGGINEIVYGAPGTGKSRYLEDRYSANTKTSRVVFHPEYSVFDFVGTYKPVPLYQKTDIALVSLGGEKFERGLPVIDYRYVPGPFIECLVDAWLNPSSMHTLIIEEINRANTAAVFGEIFQLLDRDVTGRSEYPVKPSYDLHQYLLSITGMAEILEQEQGLRIPSNMNIVATMNSADQGVMPMDSAFKRRWSFMYMKISIEEAVHASTPLRYANSEVTWGNLVCAINAKLMSLGLEEDRLVGPYFIKPSETGSQKANDKLLLYLWDDVLRHNRNEFFSNQISTFSDLSEKFETSDVFDLLSGTYADILMPVKTEKDNVNDDDSEYKE